MKAKESVRELIRKWRECSFGSKPYCFPDDNFIQEQNASFCISRSFDDFIDSDFDSYSDKSLHIGLLPIPYVGNLEAATIYVLMSNPGLSFADYYAEDKNHVFREALIRNIRQEFDDTDYPFLFLDPRFAWHPGFGYWHNKFNGFIKIICRQHACTHQQALRHLADRIACLELNPYHSEKFSQRVIKGLRSVEYVRDFVKNVLVQKANRGQALIIVARGAKYWGLRQSKNIIVYSPFESRAAHITPKTKKVGHAIAKRLDLKLTT